jgi:hypothetical protein
MSFRQSEFRTESFHPRITLKKVEFGICQCPADPKGTRRSREIERCERSILLAQSGVYQGSVERIDRRSDGRDLLCLITPTGSRIGVPEFSPNLATWTHTPVYGSFQNLDRIIDPALAYASPAHTPTLFGVVRVHHFAVAFRLFIPAGGDEHVSQTVVALR